MKLGKTKFKLLFDYFNIAGKYSVIARSERSFEEISSMFDSDDKINMFGFGENSQKDFLDSEIILDVFLKSTNDVIGFIRILFPHYKSNDSEFHCGFITDSINHRRGSFEASLLSLFWGNIICGLNPVTTVNNNYNKGLTFVNKIGFIEKNRTNDYIEMDFRWQTNTKNYIRLFFKSTDNNSQLIHKERNEITDRLNHIILKKIFFNYKKHLLNF